MSDSFWTGVGIGVAACLVSAFSFFGGMAFLDKAKAEHVEATGAVRFGGGVYTCQKVEK